MSIRALSVAGLLAAFSLLSAPSALAKARPTAVPPAPGAFFYHVYGLVPGHHYHLSIQSKGKVKFSASAVEDVLFVNSGRLGSASKSLHYNAITPRTYSISQPVKGSLQSWRLTIQVLSQKTLPLFVHVVDVSKHRG